MKEYRVLKMNFGVAFTEKTDKFEMLLLVIFSIIFKPSLFLFWNPNFISGNATFMSGCFQKHPDVKKKNYI